jgi:hypothetical protein
MKDIHRVHFKVDISEPAAKEQIMGVAQKIVKETIALENCHSIAIDFGNLGYVDYAPYGKWTKAGSISPDDYKNYKFKYIFFD